MKKICMLITGVTFTLLGYSQSTPPHVDKQIRDPQRKVNAGKADAVIANKKVIFDSTTFKNNTDDVNNKKIVKSGNKEKHCGNKTKQTSKAATLKKKA